MTNKYTTAELQRIRTLGRVAEHMGYLFEEIKIPFKSITGVYLYDIGPDEDVHYSPNYMYDSDILVEHQVVFTIINTSRMSESARETLTNQINNKWDAKMIRKYPALSWLTDDEILLIHTTNHPDDTAAYALVKVFSEYARTAIAHKALRVLESMNERRCDMIMNFLEEIHNVDSSIDFDNACLKLKDNIELWI
jgi:hypothetical protein